MRKLIMTALAVVALSLGCTVAGAQTTTPPTQHFVMSTSTGDFNGSPVAIASTGFQLTSNVSLVYEFISNPNDSSKPRVGSGIANYTRPLSDFLPAKLRSKLLIDTSNYNVTFQAGAGEESLSNGLSQPRTKHIVGNFGVYGSYPLPGGHTQVGLGYKYIVGPQGGLVKVPVGTLNFTF